MEAGKVMQEKSKYKINKSKNHTVLFRKLPSTKLTVGPFTLVSSTGVIQPGETAVVQITCTPKEKKLYQEAVLFLVSEENPSPNRGVKLQLITEGALPKIEFKNYSFIFKDHYLTKNCESAVSKNIVLQNDEK